MQFLIDAGILLAAYVFGSIPFGLIVVKMMTQARISGRSPAAERAGQMPCAPLDPGRAS